HPRHLDGPLSLVELIAKNPHATAEDLEIAAKYLIITGGDDATAHQARDLAKRAADAKPSVERFLMLAAVAEDRNAAARALEEAEKRARPNDVSVLLARAHHRRSGPSPHEAFPIYDRVLE